MKNIIRGGLLVLNIALMVFMLTGCSKKQETEPLRAPEPTPPQKLTEPPQKIFSPDYQRGYNDGYTGKWLAPFQWFFGNEYRSGHAAGVEDRKAGLPHRFHE